MRKWKLHRLWPHFLLACCLILLSGGALVRAEGTQEAGTLSASEGKKGLVIKNGKTYYYKKGKRVRNAWVNVKKNGKTRRYYFGKNGAAPKKACAINGKIYVFHKKGYLICKKSVSPVRSGKYLYIPDEKGAARSGWLLDGEDLYYAREKNGRLATDLTFRGVSFGSDGRAEMDSSGRLMKTCLRIMNSISSPSSPKPVRLSAAYNYMVNNFGYQLLWDPNFNDPDWPKDLALATFTGGAGDCVGFSCAFSGLALAIGYDPYLYYGRVPGSRDQAADGYTRHCWVWIDGAFYDPEGQNQGWLTGVYGLASYPISHQILHVIHFADGQLQGE